MDVTPTVFTNYRQKYHGRCGLGTWRRRGSGPACASKHANCLFICSHIFLSYDSLYFFSVSPKNVAKVENVSGHLGHYGRYCGLCRITLQVLFQMP